MARRRWNPSDLLLAAVLTGGVAMTLILTWEMTFFQDTWAFLINRREITADALFQPHNEHVVVFPVLVEKALLEVFGMSSAKPEYVLLALILALTALLLYVYMRRRVGSWLALFAVIIVLTLGPAWEVLLWPFEITFIAPLLFGIAMLLALEREDRLGDLAACAFLVVAVGSSGLGISFIAAAIVAIGLGPRERWLARSYVFLVPLLLYVAWWLGWGRDAESHLSIYNVLASPRFVVDSLAFAVGSMLGLGPQIGASPEPSWGRAIVVGLVIVLGYLYWRYRPRISAGLYPILAAALANWFLTAFNLFPGRDPSSSRYQYAGAIFVLMIAANLFKGVRPNRTALIVVGVVTLLAVGPNLVILKNGRQVLNPQSELTRADTAAIEIAERTIDPNFQLTEDVAGTPSLVNIYAGAYLEAVDEYGSPAYTPEELANAPDAGRRQADIILGQALPLSTVTELDAYEAGGDGAGCTAIAGGEDAPPEVQVGSGVTRIELAPGPRAEFNLRRFATEEYPVTTEGAPGGSVTELRIPADQAPGHPWFLQVEAEQPARVCPP